MNSFTYLYTGETQYKRDPLGPWNFVCYIRYIRYIVISVYEPYKTEQFVSKGLEKTVCFRPIRYFVKALSHYRCTSPELNRSTKLTTVRKSAELRRDSTWKITIGHRRAADPLRGATGALPTLTKPYRSIR